MFLHLAVYARRNVGVDPASAGSPVCVRVSRFERVSNRSSTDAGRPVAVELMLMSPENPPDDVVNSAYPTLAARTLISQEETARLIRPFKLSVAVTADGRSAQQYSSPGIRIPSTTPPMSRPADGGYREDLTARPDRRRLSFRGMVLRPVRRVSWSPGRNRLRCPGLVRANAAETGAAGNFS